MRPIVVALCVLLFCGCFKKTNVVKEDARDDQWARGVWLYGQKCASCHGESGEGEDHVPAIAGEGALPSSPREGSERKISFDSAADIFGYVKQSMPPLEAGELSDDQYYAIVHYVLKQATIEVPSGEVTPENADSIKLR